ncbi:hypothetical protein [Desulfoluna sp.]|uniref:hypothetical protein n=1 Tax=Desulfoluna sp. TaxID=2045199 RepID=UPI0026248DB8|nr:hypothetical protein [Desulfoluna sp.]
MKTLLKSCLLIITLIIMGSGLATAKDQDKKQDRTQDKKQDGSCEMIQTDLYNPLLASDQTRDKNHDGDKNHDHDGDGGDGHGEGEGTHDRARDKECT